MPLPAGSLIVSFKCPPGTRRLPDGTCGVIGIQPSPPLPPAGGGGTATQWAWFVNCNLGQTAFIPNPTMDQVNALEAAGWVGPTGPPAANVYLTQDQLIVLMPQYVVAAQNFCGLPVVAVAPPTVIP